MYVWEGTRLRNTPYRMYTSGLLRTECIFVKDSVSGLLLQVCLFGMRLRTARSSMYIWEGTRLRTAPYRMYIREGQRLRTALSRTYVADAASNSFSRYACSTRLSCLALFFVLPGTRDLPHLAIKSMSVFAACLSNALSLRRAGLDCCLQKIYS